MTIQDWQGLSVEEQEAMTDEQLLEAFKDCLIITRVDNSKVEIAKIRKTLVADAKKSTTPTTSKAKPSSLDIPPDLLAFMKSQGINI